MKKHILFCFLLLVLCSRTGFPQPLRMLPEITAAGKGKVNTKIDNIGYWYRMVQLGYVKPDPVVTVPDAKFTGSMIVPYHQPVRTGVGNIHPDSPFTPQNSPDVPVTGENDVTQTENTVFIDPSNDDAVLNSNN